MNQSKEQLHEFFQDLIREGEEVLKTARQPQKPMRAWYVKGEKRTQINFEIDLRPLFVPWYSRCGYLDY